MTWHKQIFAKYIYLSKRLVKLKQSTLALSPHLKPVHLYRMHANNKPIYVPILDTETFVYNIGPIRKEPLAPFQYMSRYASLCVFFIVAADIRIYSYIYMHNTTHLHRPFDRESRVLCAIAVRNATRRLHHHHHHHHRQF